VDEKMEPPEWMTKLFFEKALRNYEKDDNAVVSYPFT
jgi:hypothetical protein